MTIRCSGAILALALSMLAILPATLYAKTPLEDEDWLEVRTTNFVIRSLLDEQETMKLALRLEAVRAALPRITVIPEHDTQRPLSIFVLRGVKDLKAIGLDPDAERLVDETMRDYTIAVRRDPHRPLERELIDQYVRYLSAMGKVRTPRWYKVGLAGYLHETRISFD